MAAKVRAQIHDFPQVGKASAVEEAISATPTERLQHTASPDAGRSILGRLKDEIISADDDIASSTTSTSNWKPSL